MSDRHTCERCNEVLDPAAETMLELDQDTGLYHDAYIPAGHTSQGWFYFGRACARAVLANGGRLERIQRPRNRRQS